MDYDTPFRIALGIGALIFVPIGAYFRIRSQRTGERLDRRREGLFLLLTLRPLGLVTMLGLLAFLIEPAWMSWGSMPLPLPIRWTGIALGVFAGLLLVWTLHTLGANLTDTVVTRARHTLVVTGPYQWVRHPFYVAAGLALLANSLAAANWFILLTGGLTFALIVHRISIEEAELVARFGDQYQDYMARTRRFLP
jgi:protein-S-isoprenylcysteine O-methyltransferase Ste14